MNRPKRYADAYKITDLISGKVVIVDSIKEVSKCTGYAQNSVNNLIKGCNHSTTYKIEKLYY